MHVYVLSARIERCVYIVSKLKIQRRHIVHSQRWNVRMEVFYTWGWKMRLCIIHTNVYIYGYL